MLSYVKGLIIFGMSRYLYPDYNFYFSHQQSAVSSIIAQVLLQLHLNKILCKQSILRFVKTLHP